MSFESGASKKVSKNFRHGFIYDATGSVTDECETLNRTVSMSSAWELGQCKGFPPSPMVTPPPRGRKGTSKGLDQASKAFENPVASLSIDTPFGGVPHIYNDYSKLPDIHGFVRKKTGGVSQPFPDKMHEMLASVENDEEEQSIVSWLPHGRAFIVRCPVPFTLMIMPK
jgi:hypothetical protein